MITRRPTRAVLTALAIGACTVMMGVVDVPAASAVATDPAPSDGARLVEGQILAVQPQQRGAVPFKRFKGTYPIGSWRKRVGVHKVKVVVAYTQQAPSLDETVSAVRSAGDIWAREVSGMQFVFSAPVAAKRSQSVICDPSRVWKSVSNKRKLGKNRHLLVVAPECEATHGGWGFGDVGRGSGRAFVTANYAPGIAHELGHNLGLLHENGLKCVGKDGRPVPLSNRCTELEYEDDGTLMGGGDPRLGPTGHALLTTSAYRIKSGRTSIVTISNVGGPGRRVAVLKGSQGTFLFDLSPGSDTGDAVEGGGLQARLVTAEGTGLLRLPDSSGAMSAAADSVLGTGESWVVPGTGMRVSILAHVAGSYVTVRFGPA